MSKSHDIIIIDSGVNLEHPAFNKDLIEGFSVFFDKGAIGFNSDFQDKYGHGSAVYGIIRKRLPKAKILNIKLFEEYNSVVASEELILLLNYIYENFSCKIINLSLGLRVCENIQALYNISKKFEEKETLIISAFDNEGYFSYPAGFDCVIGIDSDATIKSSKEYFWLGNSATNIQTYGATQKLPWVEPLYNYLGGNSMACAHASAIVFEALINSENINEAKNYLRKNAAQIKVFPAPESDEIPFEIKRAALFPFNKEMRALIRFRELLSFEISEVYDVKYSGRVGASCYKLINFNKPENFEDLIIKNFELIDFSEIDAIIIGHLDELNALVFDDVRKRILENAFLNNINIYSFDDLDVYKSRSGSNFFYPSVKQEHYNYAQLEKLYCINKPVVGIFGTSSRQGKYTLLISLKQELEKNDYTVGCVSTEPNGHLFNIKCMPIGYNAEINVNEHQFIHILNNKIHELSEKSEIILAAGQANSIPICDSLLEAIPVKQHQFVLGLQPDIILLCVNYFDDVNYIKNTIKYLEGSTKSQVIALVASPFANQVDNRRASKSDKSSLDFENNFKIPCYDLEDKNTVKALHGLIINYLGDNDVN